MVSEKTTAGVGDILLHSFEQKISNV